jgi:anion transporter
MWFGVAILAALIVAHLPISGLPHDAQITLALFVFMVILWIFEVLPVGLAAVLWAMLLVVIIGGKTVPAKVAFGGFTKSTVWLIMGAFLLGQATVKTGVAERIAYHTMRLGGSSYTKVLIFLWIAATILGVLTPSGTVRVSMFIPIMGGILAAYGASTNSRFAANLLMHVYWGSILGSTLWYTGSNINPTAMGNLESVIGYSPSFAVWFVWQIFPCLVMAAGSFVLIQLVLPPEKEIIAHAGSITAIDEKLKEMGPMTTAEKKALAFFALAVVLWITEPFHGIDTAWVAILVGILLFLPGVGVLGEKAIKNISWDTILLLGIALGIDGIMKAVRLDTWLTKSLLSPILDPLISIGPIGLALGITLFVFVVHFLIASAAATTAILSPLLVQYAHLKGVSVTLAAMVAARSAMNVFIFPYQTTMFIILWGTGYMNMKQCLRGFGIMAVWQLIWICLMAPYWDWIMNVIR